MQKKILVGFGVVASTIAGSLLVPSCASRQPASNTTINVQVPAATAADKTANGETEIADLRTSDDIDANKTKSEPTDRDVEESAPAKKSVSKSSSSRQSKSQLMDFYDRLPAKHFAAFGGVNRRSLLNRKGAIVDYKHNFIEIPGSSDERDGDLRRLQITLFPNGDEPWCAVSRIVWPNGQTPGALDFYYGESDDPDRHPRKVSEDFFPYELGRFDGGYMSAYLPQRGLDIFTSSNVDSEANGDLYHYNRNFRVGEPAFKKIPMPDEG